MNADHLIVAAIVCAALVYLIARLRAKKQHDCCCGSKSKAKRPSHL
jgi:hypothetical protein